MKFVLTDTKEFPAELMESVLGRVNCHQLTIDGARFAPGAALVRGMDWGADSDPIFINVERIQSKLRGSADLYPSIDVDNLLKRCHRQRTSWIARVLRRLRRIGR